MRRANWTLVMLGVVLLYILINRQPIILKKVCINESTSPADTKICLHDFQGQILHENLTTRRLSERTLIVDKHALYLECRNFSQTSRLIGPLRRNSSNGKLYFPDVQGGLQELHLIMRYSPRSNSEGGLSLSVATSYLISHNLQRLSKDQRDKTRMTVFLSEKFDAITFSRLATWFDLIYRANVRSIVIIRAPVGNQASWEFSMNYVKRNKDINLDTIVFQLEDDYVCEADMLKDTIEFFASHNPCFVHPSDYPDRYLMPINDDDGQITIVAGRTRVWRSATSATVSYACRLKTLLAFADVLFQPQNDWINSKKVRKRGGNAAIFSAIPSYCSHTEAAIYSDGDSHDVAMAALHKDWWSIARQAALESQKHPCYPI